MINDNDKIIYITTDKLDSEGNPIEEPIRVLKEFENPDNGKHFIFYVGIEDDVEEIYVAQIFPEDSENGSIEDVETEEDAAFCQEMFDDFYDEITAQLISEEEMEEDEEESESVVN